MSEHILSGYDVKLVGSESEIRRYRTHVMKMREALEYLHDGRSDLPNWAAGVVEETRRSTSPLPVDKP